MRILGIETSCDETGAAIIEINTKKNKIEILSNVISSSVSFHAKTGGIIPETAAREQIKFIIPVIDEAIKKSGILNTTPTFNPDHTAIYKPDIDAIAVTTGPGLIGSLLVGVETAKTLAWIWNKPIIPVNHLLGHIYANFFNKNPEEITFPALALIVSGGHTDLLLLKKHGDLQWISGTRDDAAGEALDKIGRLLGLPYPAGPLIEKLAKNGNSKRFFFPRPLLHEKTYDFSFSGLKTAVLREVTHLSRDKILDRQTIFDIACCTQDAIIDVLTKKTFSAAKEYNAKSILMGGGVASNLKLIQQFEMNKEKINVNLFYPEKNLCTDNAAMIAVCAYFNFNKASWKNIKADPDLYFD